MPNPVTPDFITKKVACRTYNRSHRQLTRDLGAAMAARDETILANFKVRTEDGDVLDGIDITTDLISTLRSDGRNPMWYVREAWMEKSFGRRLDRPDLTAREEVTDRESEIEPEPAAGAPDEIVVLLKEQIRKLEDDKKDLQDDKRALREELSHRNDRERETNVLMQDLHKLLAHMQQGLLPEKTDRNPPVDFVSAAQPIVNANPVAPEQGTRSAPRRSHRKTPRGPTNSRTVTSPVAKRNRATSNPEAPSIWQRDLRDFLPFRRK